MNPRDDRLTPIGNPPISFRYLTGSGSNREYHKHARFASQVIRQRICAHELRKVCRFCPHDLRKAFDCFLASRGEARG